MIQAQQVGLDRPSHVDGEAMNCQARDASHALRVRRRRPVDQGDMTASELGVEKNIGRVDVSVDQSQRRVTCSLQYRDQFLTIECDCFSELVIDLFAVLLKKCPSTGDKPLGLNRGAIDGRGQLTSLFQVGSPPPLGVKNSERSGGLFSVGFRHSGKTIA